MKVFTISCLSLLLVITLRESYFPQAFSYQGNIQFNFTPEDEKFLDSLQRETFDYFWIESNPSNGLVKDRSTDTSPASIAATGFGVAAWAIGSEHNWITREEAAERTLRLLGFLMSSEQSPAPDATGYNGFYYHFLKMDSGRREWKCELSTIDTAWLLAGLRFARQFYDGSGQMENEIRSLADKLTFRVNWDWTVLKAGKYRGFITQAWHPENGFLDLGWFGYNESLFLFILSAGSTLSDPLPVYNNWLSTYKWKTKSEALQIN